MKNPVNVNSANVRQFGFSSTFDLNAKNLTIDFSQLTEFIGSGATLIVGISVDVLDPSGYQFDQQTNFNPSILNPIVFNIGSVFNFGPFTITGRLTDQDGKVTVIELNKSINEPECWEDTFVKGIFDIDVNCKAPEAIIHDKTKMAYFGKQPVSVTKSGKLYYPDNVVSELAFTFTPFSVGGSDGLYTGGYRIKNLTLAKYDIGDNVSVIIPYQTRQEFNVTCESSLRSVLCCVSDLYQEATGNVGNSKSASAREKLDFISIDLTVALLKDAEGSDNSFEVDKIKKYLNCDCGCKDGDFIEPQLNGGSAGANFSIQGNGGSAVSVQTVGGAKLFTVTSKLYSVVKTDVSDLALTITKSGSGNNSTFAIGLNYEVLAATLLNTIGGSETLTNLLNQIVNGTNGFDIQNVNGKCVINLSACSYSLIEPASSLKTITAILIDGVSRPAPNGLSTLSTTAIKTWLDSLGLGTFSATLNGSSTQLTILSTGNTHAVSTITFTLDGNPLVRQVNKDCGSISAIIQAIIDYLCDLHTADIDLSQTITVSKRVGSTVTTDTFASGTPLTPLLVALASVISYYANNPITPTPGDPGADGRSVKVFVQPGQPTTDQGTFANGDIWIVQ